MSLDLKTLIADSPATDAETLYRGLGYFWTDVFGAGRGNHNREAVKGYAYSISEEVIQQYMRLLEILNSYSVDSVPVYSQEKWYPIRLLRSQKNRVPLLFNYENFATFGPQADGLFATRTFKVGEPKTPKSFIAGYPLPANVAELGIITDRIFDPQHLLTSGEDFIIKDNFLYFLKDPFLLTDVPTNPTIALNENVESDAEIVLWGYHAKVDKEYLFKAFGYLVELHMKSDDFYKNILGAAIHAHSGGLTIDRILEITCAFFEVPICKRVGEIVIQTITSEEKTKIITNQSVYTIPAFFQAPAVNTVLVLGKPVSPILEYFDAVAKSKWYTEDGNLNQLHIPKHFFSENLGKGLTVNRLSTFRIEQSSNVNNFQFPFIGDSKDVEAYHNFLKRGCSSNSEACALANIISVLKSKHIAPNVTVTFPGNNEVQFPAGTVLEIGRKVKFSDAVPLDPEITYFVKTFDSTNARATLSITSAGNAALHVFNTPTIQTPPASCSFPKDLNFREFLFEELFKSNYAVIDLNLTLLSAVPFTEGGAAFTKARRIFYNKLTNFSKFFNTIQGLIPKHIFLLFNISAGFEIDHVNLFSGEHENRTGRHLQGYLNYLTQDREDMVVANKKILNFFATLTFEGNHYFSIGDKVHVTGVDSTFDGFYEITEKTDTSISYAKPSTLDVVEVGVIGGKVNFQKTETLVTRLIAVGIHPFSVTHKEFSGGNLATLTVALPSGLSSHNFQKGSTVLITEVHPLFNGTYTVNADPPDSTSFTFSKTVTQALTHRKLLFAVPTSTLELTTANSHNLSSGDGVTVSGVNTVFDGTFIVQSTPTPTTFTVPLPTVNISNKALTSNEVTLTTATAHNLAVNVIVVVASVGSPFDGTHTVTATPTPTTFTYVRNHNTNVGSVASTGTVQVEAIPITASVGLVNLITSQAAAVNPVGNVVSLFGDEFVLKKPHPGGVTGGVDDSADGVGGIFIVPSVLVNGAPTNPPTPFTTSDIPTLVLMPS